MTIPKVSIIVPIYNVEKYLDRCLSSIAKQSYSNIEVLMVDDGSLDCSALIAHEYESKYSNFTLIKQDNKGLGGARNTGINHSTGDYIMMPDSDDWVHENYVKKMVETALKYNADVVECNGVQSWDNGFQKRRRYHIKNLTIIEEKSINEYLRNFSFVVWNKLFKREIIIGYSFHEHMTKQDYAWTPIIVSKARKIVQIEDVLYYYYWRSDSATNLKRINYDLLKAQQILESNINFKRDYSNILQLYFVRNVMGDFIWMLSLNGSNKNYIRGIMNNAKKLYPNISSDFHVLGTAKSIWAYLIYKDYIDISYLYSNVFQAFHTLCHQILCLLRGT